MTAGFGRRSPQSADRTSREEQTVRSRGWIVWAFMAPVLLVMTIIVFYPLARGVF